jgi:L-ascorbate metabolism protein UlaG (beta-lactamase superfamily)
MQVTYIGGSTALLEVDGLRLLTDPTFDPPGTSYTTPVYTLRKTTGPAVPLAGLGHIDVVLLSHDHHFDNLDHAGRAMLSRATKVVTTSAGAARLGGSAVGLAPWETIDIATPLQRRVRVTGTPARHGPTDGDRGPVTGFVLTVDEQPESGVYVSGDTVWYEGMADIAQRFPIKLAILFMGAARVPEVGPHHLTLTAEEGVVAARAFSQAAIVPLHFEGWAHFSEGRADIEAAFAKANLANRLHWLTPGVAVRFDPGSG